MIKKRAIDSKSRSNEFIKSFSFSIRNKIFKEIDYNSEDFITYDYERMKRKAFNAYTYKEKRKHYIEIIDLKYMKFREEYLDIIV